MECTAQRERKSLRKLRGLITPLLLLVAVALHLGADGLTEAKVKAAFLYSFTKFVSWPANRPVMRTEPFTICALGERPLEGMIAETMRGKSVEERPLRTRHVETKQGPHGCQVLFIPSGEYLDQAEVAVNPAYFGVLTVSDNQSSGRSSHFDSVITFVLRDGKVRFVINNKAAERAGLTISSRLLTLALEVEQ